MKKMVSMGMAALAAVLLSTSANAGKSDDTINVVWDRETTTLDFYYAIDHEALSLARNVWDGLVDRDPATGKILPNLATEWSWESDTSLVMTLREGVRFQNGEEFDADDVVFTMNYVADPANKVRSLMMVSWIAGAEKIDKYKVRIKLKYPLASALEYLSLGVPIYPNEYYAKVGPNGFATAPIGTGPYKVASFKPGVEYALERNDDYFKGGSKSFRLLKTSLCGPRRTTT
ncbi:ABC transporter substrate-binding protein [Mesorhizobium sp. 8]|uniref:ABC transporter substrate-binding protein n=1 Tax=Mesorhizobium sp. 8 TaxID=2584466 RepID=UPI0015D66403|nr:ABC transporter substrate-binding protein [Mesorhizobium sp. 8]